MTAIDKDVPAKNVGAPGPRANAVAPARGFRWASLKDLLLVPAIIGVLIVGYFVDHKFLSGTNLMNVLEIMSAISLIVLAEALVLIVGKMDLSLESTFGLAPGIAIWACMGTANVGGFAWASEWMTIPMAILVGGIIGTLNGLLIIKFGLNGFIVTLAMLIALRGLLTFLTGGETLRKVPDSVFYLGGTPFLGIPVNVLISVVLFAAGYFVLTYTRLGRALFAIGGNAAAARAAGIRVDRVVWTVLIIASVLAALGGLIYTGQFASVQVSQGDGYIFQVFAACVIGGISLNGGRGSDWTA
jgi:simple sugar transport system permease protein